MKNTEHKSKSTKPKKTEAEEAAIIDGKRIERAAKAIDNLLQSARGFQHLLQHARSGDSFDTNDARAVQLKKDLTEAGEIFFKEMYPSPTEVRKDEREREEKEKERAKDAERADLNKPIPHHTHTGN